MRLFVTLMTFALAAGAARGEVIFSEDFEDGNLAERGWSDIRDQRGGKRLLTVVGVDDVKPISGLGCLRIDYPRGATGGWMHMKLKKHVGALYCRYYRLFPKGWEWPRGYGPHDSALFAGAWGGAPTNAVFEILVDFNRSSNTFLKICPSRQKWGYAGFGRVLQRYSGSPNHLGHNVASPDKVELGKWHCVEYYCKLSDAGKANGQLKMWVNGKLVSEVLAIPLVDEKHGGILFNRWMVSPYFHGGSHKVQRNYLDAVVISTEYVGTIEQKGNQPPRARFAHARDWGSMTATFDASRSADPETRRLSYAWRFGDGRRGAGGKVSHRYAAPGDYTVKLTVTDEGGESHSDEMKIRVGPEVGSGGGLKGEYWNGTEFKGEPVVTLLAPEVAFRRRGWEGRYINGYVGDEKGTNYSCRWTGFLQPTRSEEYTLTFEVGEGGRVWFDGKLVIEATTTPKGSKWAPRHLRSAPVGKLDAGKKYPIKVEQYKGSYKTSGVHRWRAMLYWESPSTKKQPIPSDQFYPPEGFVAP